MWLGHDGPKVAKERGHLMGRFVTRQAAIGKILAATAVGALALTLVSACGKDQAKAPVFVGGNQQAAPAASPTAPPVPFEFAVTPADKKKDVPVSTEIGIKVTGGKVTTVGLTDKAGKAVSGALREDGSAWVPAKPLKTNTTYDGDSRRHQRGRPGQDHEDLVHHDGQVGQRDRHRALPVRRQDVRRRDAGGGRVQPGHRRRTGPPYRSGCS